jgi:hypothetical protein
VRNCALTTKDTCHDRAFQACKSEVRPEKDDILMQAHESCAFGEECDNEMDFIVELCTPAML